MRLGALLRDRWEFVEADMMRFYGIDLRRMDVGARRLWAYVQALPRDAATFREEVEKEWRLHDELLASILEATDYWGRVAAGVWGVKGSELGKMHPPRMVEHEGRMVRAARKALTSDPAQIRSFFRQHVAGVT